MKTIIKCSSLVIVISALIFFIFVVTGGYVVSANSDNIKSFLNLNSVDSVKITYWPHGDLPDTKTILIKESKIIDKIVQELEKIPARGPGRRAKIDSSAPEYRIEFFEKSIQKGFLRIKADMLDAPFEPSWDFYGEGVDKQFVNLIKKLI